MVMIMIMVVGLKYAMKMIFCLRVRIQIQQMSMAPIHRDLHVLFQSFFRLSDNGLNVLLVFFSQVLVKFSKSFSFQSTTKCECLPDLLEAL